MLINLPWVTIGVPTSGFLLASPPPLRLGHPGQLLSCVLVHALLLAAQ